MNNGEEMGKVIFTICAKNYLAQALTLRESVLRHNKDVEFFIYLADDATGMNVDGLITLDDSWIPGWIDMAFKYDVVEFNTSIKPFCFNHLFIKGYEKVVYLDPDIYVTSSLKCVFDVLNDKSVALTPHYCDIEEQFSGMVPESVVNNVGIYNLGFCAIKNNDIGKSIVKWWMNRLKTQCYNDMSNGLFVDQKWMDYIPGFYPKDTFIFDDHGLNVAIWNLHERDLLIGENGNYVIRRKRTGEESDLIFFHFSGFNPHNSTTINKHHPQFNVEKYAAFKPIIGEYRKSILDNNYDCYSKKSYAFNYYQDGGLILPLHRRMYRLVLEDNKLDTTVSPFDVNSVFYKLLKSNKLMVHPSKKGNSKSVYSDVEKKRGKTIERKVIRPMLRMFLKLFGVRRYVMLIRLFNVMSPNEYHYFLIHKF